MAQIKYRLLNAHFSPAPKIEPHINFEGTIALLVYPSIIADAHKNTTKVEPPKEQQNVNIPKDSAKEIQTATTSKDAVNESQIAEAPKEIVKEVQFEEKAKNIPDDKAAEVVKDPLNLHRHKQNTDKIERIITSKPVIPKPITEFAAIILRIIDGQLLHLASIPHDAVYYQTCGGILDSNEDYFALFDYNVNSIRIRLYSIHDNKINLEKTRIITSLHDIANVYHGEFLENGKYLYVTYSVNNKTILKIIKTNDFLDMYEYQVDGNLLMSKIFQMKDYYFAAILHDSVKTSLQIYQIPSNNHDSLKLLEEQEVGNKVEWLLAFPEFSERKNNTLITLGYGASGNSNGENRHSFRINASPRTPTVQDIKWFIFHHGDKSSLKMVGAKNCMMPTQLQIHPTGGFVATNSSLGSPISDILTFSTLEKNPHVKDCPELYPSSMSYHIAPQSKMVFSGNGKYLLAAGMSTGKLHNNILLFEISYEYPHVTEEETIKENYPSFSVDVKDERVIKPESPKKIKKESPKKAPKKDKKESPKKDHGTAKVIDKEIECPYCQRSQREHGSHVSHRSYSHRKPGYGHVYCKKHH